MNYDLFVIKEIVINREIVKHCIHNSKLKYDMTKVHTLPSKIQLH